MPKAKARGRDPSSHDSPTENDVKTLQNKVVVITGAGSGIGRALAVSAAAAGASIAISDWNLAGAEETAQKSGASPGRVLVRKVDVRSDDEVNAFAADVQKEMGGAHVVVNNAGVSLSHAVGHMKREDFAWLMDINFWGVVRGTEAFLPQLRARDEAHIVNISSVFGLIGVPTQSAYNASKFAVRGFTESLAQELDGTRVHVSVVCPGGVKTGIAANGRHYQDAFGNETNAQKAAKDFERLAGTTPERAAAIIWKGVLRNDPRILVGPDAKLIQAMVRLFPNTYPRIVKHGMALGERLRGR